MELVELKCLMHELPRGPFGIRTPTGEARENERIDAVLVPGVAFDHEGGRLGRGGGYYDRLLAQMGDTLTIGTAFECQLESELPRETHDRAVRFIATEKGVFEC
jgi:5-formyltetrahydrofolate cyclo-ligase